ncbi:MAG: diguanylate cyclase [Bulleidia sp.]|nr:diguanylate cyclase [Bulleidia sp.]
MVQYQVALYEEVNLIGVIILLLVMLRITVDDHMDRVNRCFMAGAGFETLNLVADMVNCWLEYRQVFPQGVLLCLMISGISTMIVMLYWVWFVEGFTNERPGKKLRYALRLPAYMTIALILTTPFNHLVYGVSIEGQYIYGPLYFLKTSVTLFYLVVQLVMIANAARKSTNPDIKREYRSFWLISFFPILGVILQKVLGPAVPCLNPAMAIAILWGYLGITSRRSSIDFLTSLSNRSVLSKVMHELMADSRLKKEYAGGYYLYMMDLNHFKQINDTYGHQEGDHALILAASALREVFDGQRGCLCRYGGDEFAAVVRCDEITAAKLRDQIDARMDLLKIQNDLPYDLSMSAGYIKATARNEEELKNQFHEADTAMYADKQRMEGNEAYSVL